MSTRRRFFISTAIKSKLKQSQCKNTGVTHSWFKEQRQIQHTEVFYSSVTDTKTQCPSRRPVRDTLAPVQSKPSQQLSVIAVSHLNSDTEVNSLHFCYDASSLWRWVVWCQHDLQGLFTARMKTVFVMINPKNFPTPLLGFSSSLSCLSSPSSSSGVLYQYSLPG